jgi:lysine 6-dehydrogenase
MSTRKKILVLGAGMVGREIANDLHRQPEYLVAVADRDETALSRASCAVRHVLDLADMTALQRLAHDYDLIVGALPSHLGFSALKAIIEAQRDYCDVSFMVEDALQVDAEARQRGVTAVVDCGVAPGLTNMLVGCGASALERCTRVAVAIGGLPAQPRWPFNYKAGFSPRDVLEEYIRPVRMIEDGQIVERDALSDPESITFEGLGTFEAFNTDGLRTLLTSIVAEQMSEKTIRYPGHAELMRVLKHLGLFSEQVVSLATNPQCKLKPIELTEQLLFPHWKFDEGEADLTVMRVTVEGESASGPIRRQWEMLDRYDPVRAVRSMSRVTAYSCTSVVRLMAEGTLEDSGVIPPEKIGSRPELLEHVLADLKQRNMIVRETA